MPIGIAGIAFPQFGFPRARLLVARAGDFVITQIILRHYSESRKPLWHSRQYKSVLNDKLHSKHLLGTRPVTISTRTSFTGYGNTVEERLRAVRFAHLQMDRRFRSQVFQSGCSICCPVLGHDATRLYALRVQTTATAGSGKHSIFKFRLICQSNLGNFNSEVIRPPE